MLLWVVLFQDASPIWIRGAKMKISVHNKEYNKQVIIRKVKPVIWSLCRTVILLVFLYLLIYPLMYMIVTVFRDAQDFRDPSIHWITRNFSLDNIKYAIEYLDYDKTLLYSTEIALGSAILQTISCALAGYSFARFKFKFKGLAFAVLIATIIVPPQTTLLPLFSVIRKMNLLNTAGAFWVQAALGSGLRSGLFVFIYCQFFKGLPIDLEHAASIDGCSPIGTFFKVMLPNVVPGIVTVFFFSVVWHFNENFVTKYLSLEKETLASVLNNFRSTIELASASSLKFDIMTAQGIVQAGSLLTLLPMLLLYFFLQKYLREGVARAGIVG